MPTEISHCCAEFARLIVTFSQNQLAEKPESSWPIFMFFSSPSAVQSKVKREILPLSKGWPGVLSTRRPLRRGRPPSAPSRSMNTFAFVPAPETVPVRISTS